MGEMVQMLDEFLRMLEADRGELAARFDQGKLAGQAEAQQGLQRMFSGLDEVRERVLAMRTKAAELEKRVIDDPRVALQRPPKPAVPPPTGWMPGDSPLSDAEIAEAGERLLRRARVASQPAPQVPAATGDVAAMSSSSWESQGQLPAPPESSDAWPAESKPPAKKRRGDDVSEMESEEWKR